VRTCFASILRMSAWLGMMLGSVQEFGEEAQGPVRLQMARVLATQLREHPKVEQGPLDFKQKRAMLCP
jgi:hypothetical protein